MSFTVTIDWLGFTIKGNPNNVNSMLAFVAPDGIMEPIKPRFGFTRASRLQNGIDVLSSGSGDSVVAHFVVSGSALQACDKAGIRPIEILRYAILLGAKTTRIDLAKDAKDEQVELVELASLASTGDFTGTAQKSSVVQSSDGGTTVYVGSRQSERFVRIYDKGIESGEGGDWVRLEMETKGETAHMVAMALATDSATINDTLCGAVRKMCAFNVPGWARLLNSDAEWSLPKIEKRSDTALWIQNQVTPAIVNYIEKEGRTDAIEHLLKHLKEALEQVS